MINFVWNGASGRVNVAALPLREFSETKKKAAMKQALYLIRDHFLAAFNAQFYQSPGLVLIPYLIGQGNQTVYEAIVDGGRLPLLAANT